MVVLILVILSEYCLKNQVQKIFCWVVSLQIQNSAYLLCGILRWGGIKITPNYVHGVCTRALGFLKAILDRIGTIINMHTEQEKIESFFLHKSLLYKYSGKKSFCFGLKKSSRHVMDSSHYCRIFASSCSEKKCFCCLKQRSSTLIGSHG